MKGQITKHEWEGPFDHTSYNSPIYICSNCKCKKKFELGQWAYALTFRDNWHSEEPKCIHNTENDSNSIII